MLNYASITYLENGSLYSNDFEDIYFQPQIGEEEAQHVFIKANKLEARFKSLRDTDIFTIAELGFGTGLNFFLCCKYWDKNAPSGAILNFISIEKLPIKKTDLQKIYKNFEGLKKYSDILLDKYPRVTSGIHRIEITPNISLTLILEDVRQGIKEINTIIDVWFLDGFAPSKNSEMWEDKIFKYMQKISPNDTTLSSFTVAGKVRRALEGAGFTVKKLAGCGKKREILSAKQSDNKYSKKKDIAKTAIIIGAGIAGCASAYALARRGIQVTILEKNSKIADAASGNIIGVSYPRLTAAKSDFGDFYQQAFLYNSTILNELGANTGFKKTGCIMLNYSKQIEEKNKSILKTLDWDNDLAQWLDKEEAAKIAGVELNHSALFYPTAGYLSPRDFCQTLLKQYPNNIDLKLNEEVKSISYDKKNKIWQAGNYSADILVIASGTAIAEFEQVKWLIKNLQFIAGQVSHIPATPQSKKLKTVIAHAGYIPPAVNNIHYAGASFHRLQAKDCSFQETIADHLDNIDLIAKKLPSLGINKTLIDVNKLYGRAQIRTSTTDHLPIIGKVPNFIDWQIDYGDLKYGKILEKDIDFATASYIEGLYIIGGLGSHGMTSAPLAGEIIASEVMGETLPLPRKTSRAVHAGRYITKAIKRGK